MKEYKSSKGSLTVEASLIFPIVILAIAIVIFIAFLLYQYIYIDASLNLAAERGVALRQNINADISTGRVSSEAYLDKPLYYSPFSVEKRSKIESYLLDKTNLFNMLTPSRSNIDVASTNYILYQSLVIKMDENYRLPAGRIFELIGLNEGINRVTRAEVTVNEPEELIRNIDLIQQILGLK